MKHIITAILLLSTIYANQADDFMGRKGFMFGEGIVALGGCDKQDIWDESGNVIGTDKYCSALPLLDVGIGYNFTHQFGLSVDIKTLLIVNLVGLKAKYYFKDAQDTAFVSVTGGAFHLGNAHSGVIGSYNNIELGYAYGHNEFAVGMGKPYGDAETTLLHLGYKYIF